MRGDHESALIEKDSHHSVLMGLAQEEAQLKVEEAQYMIRKHAEQIEAKARLYLVRALNSSVSVGNQRWMRTAMATWTRLWASALLVTQGDLELTLNDEKIRLDRVLSFNAKAKEELLILKAECMRCQDAYKDQASRQQAELERLTNVQRRMKLEYHEERAVLQARSVKRTQMSTPVSESDSDGGVLGQTVEVKHVSNPKLESALKSRAQFRQKHGYCPICRKTICQHIPEHYMLTSRTLQYSYE